MLDTRLVESPSFGTLSSWEERRMFWRATYPTYGTAGRSCRIPNP